MASISGHLSYQAEPGVGKAWQVGKNRIVVTNISLPHELEDGDRSTVNLIHARLDDDTSSTGRTASAALATLVPNVIETVSVNITLNRTENVAFEVLGKNTIHLSGHYMGLYNMLPPTDDLFDARPPKGDFLSSISARSGQARASGSTAGPSTSARAAMKRKAPDSDEEEDDVSARNGKTRASGSSARAMKRKAPDSDEEEDEEPAVKPKVKKVRKSTN
ncbi:hypothetical protein BDZ89DRAFT_1144865 [Hymenopellis radicata]|nr:hypothetical protein BDZ89DRAFT_1144865 [Hymenopellis radicata]